MDYTLQPNEGIVLQSINVKHVGGSDFADELILTNLNIIYIDRGWFTKNVKNVVYYSISEIKRINLKPQVYLGFNGKDGSQQLQISFNSGVESFEFFHNAKSEINKWIKAINSMIEKKEADGQSQAIPGVKRATETIRDTLGVIFSTLTENHRKKQILTIKCISCNALITGQKNEMVKCKYCDTLQKIK